MRRPEQLPGEPGTPPPYLYLGADPILGPTVEAVGPLSISPADDFFARLVQSVVRQQISMEAADAIFTRLTDEGPVTPGALRSMDRETLRAIGLSDRKIDTIRAIARAGLDRATLAGMSDQAVIEELTAITGIGPWTAKMQLIFSLGRPDVFPVEDLGIRRALVAVCNRDMSRSQMRQVAARWRPYRSVAAVYLWRRTE